MQPEVKRNDRFEAAPAKVGNKNGGKLRRYFAGRSRDMKSETKQLNDVYGKIFRMHVKFLRTKNNLWSKLARGESSSEKDI